MKKQALIFLVSMVFLAVLAGCATTGRVQETDVRVAKIEGFTQALNLKLGTVENDVRANKEATELLKADLGATKNKVREVAQRVEKAEGDIGATKTQVQGLGQKAEDLEKGMGLVKLELKNELRQVEKEYKNLKTYALAIRKTVAEREALHSFKKDVDLENVNTYFIGYFETGKSAIDDSARGKALKKQLENVLANVKNKNLEIKEIHAFASITGTPEGNKELSEKRAKAVSEWLKTKEVEVTDDKIVGLGGVTKFGTLLDNQSAIIFAVPKLAAPPAKTP